MSEASKTIKGSIIHVATLLSERVVGLIGTLILARLLVPDDFGIVAITMLVMGFAGALSSSGMEQYIIRLDSVCKSAVDTAWTFNIILKVLVSITIILAAGNIAEFFEDDRVENILFATAAMMMIGTLVSPSIALLKRDQNYAPLFKLSITQKVLSAIITISVAIVFKSYWALILGHITSNVIKAVGSYLIYQYRPSLTLSELKTQIGFSQWMLGRSVFGYSRSQADTFLVSKFFAVSDVGAYHVMKYISTMPATQIINPAFSTLLATYSRSKNDMEKLAYQINISLFMLLLLSLPLAIFINWSDQLLVSLFLGSHWVEHAEIFGILSMLIISFSLTSVTSQILVALGKVRWLFFYDVLTLIFMVALLYSLRDGSLSDFAWYRVVFDISIASLLLWFCSLNINKLQMINAIVVALYAILSSYLFIEIINQLPLDSIHFFIDLCINAALFFTAHGIFGYLFIKLYLGRLPEGQHLLYLINEYKVKVFGIINRRLNH